MSYVTYEQHPASSTFSVNLLVLILDWPSTVPSRLNHLELLPYLIWTDPRLCLCLPFEDLRCLTSFLPGLHCSVSRSKAAHRLKFRIKSASWFGVYAQYPVWHWKWSVKTSINLITLFYPSISTLVLILLIFGSIRSPPPEGPPSHVYMLPFSLCSLLDSCVVHEGMVSSALVVFSHVAVSCHFPCDFHCASCFLILVLFWLCPCLPPWSDH